MKNADMLAMPVTVERIGLTGDRITTPRGGLTKREYFAALAMQGFCAAPDSNGGCDIFSIAATAVRQADALLAELEKEAT